MKIIKFGAEWCSPCKAMKISKMQDEFKDIEFITIDIDDNPDKAKQYKIKSIPTLIFLENDVEVKRIVGMQKESQIRKEIQQIG